jgi:hypothetical protein
MADRLDLIQKQHGTPPRRLQDQSEADKTRTSAPKALDDGVSDLGWWPQHEQNTRSLPELRR